MSFSHGVHSWNLVHALSWVPNSSTEHFIQLVHLKPKFNWSIAHSWAQLLVE